MWAQRVERTGLGRVALEGSGCVLLCWIGIWPRKWKGASINLGRRKNAGLFPLRSGKP